jgi:glycosyltransferase involved in cell wall biosynthesis
MNKRVLLFFPFCFTARSQGNEVRVLKVLEFLSRNNFTVDVLSYQNRDGYVWAKQPEPLISGVLEVVQFGGIVKRALRKAIAVLGAPFWGFSRIDIELILRLKRLLRQHVYSHAVVSYADWAYLLSFVSDASTVKVCDTHDIWTLVECGRGGVSPRPSSVAKALAWEMSVLNKADRVIAISPFERTFFSNFLDSDVDLVPVPFDRPEYGPASRKLYDILYVGSGNHYNLRGLRWFLNKVLPAFRDLRMAVAGTICGTMETEIASFPNITSLGFQQNLGPVYQQARAAICPMIGGAGVKVKVVEALAHGVPVIGSAVIASGLLPGFERACYLADDKDGFVALLARLDEIVAESRPLEYAEKYSTSQVDSALARIFDSPMTRAKDRRTQCFIGVGRKDARGFAIVNV